MATTPSRGFTRRGLLATALRTGLGTGASAGLITHRPSAAASSPWVAVQIGSFGTPAGTSAGTQAVPEVLQLGEGMRACFDAINERGGIQGDRLNLVQIDDGNDAERLSACFKEALAQKPLALLSPYGSPTVQRLLKDRLLDSADLVVLNAVPGAEAFRKPGHARLFHLRAGDGQQIERIVRHVRLLGVQRMAVLAVDAPGGHSGLAAADEAARTVGGLVVQRFLAGLDAASQATAARALVAAEPQSVLVVGPPRFMAEAIVALRGAGHRGSVFALSYLSPELLVQVAGPQAHGVGISQAFPNPMGIVLPLQREFQAAMRRSHPHLQRYTAFQLEGYVCARLFADVARRLKERSADSFARTLRNSGEWDIGGWRLDFSRGNAGSRHVDIAIVNQDGRLAY